MARSFELADRPIVPTSNLGIYFDGQYSTPRLHHPEGIAVDVDGSVWCGNAEGDILRIRDGGASVEKLASTGGFILGLALDGRGRLYACDQRSAAVWQLDIASGDFAPLPAPGLRIPNYPVIDARRNALYVSDSYAGREAGPGVWRYDLANGEGRLWWDQPMVFANGMALSDDGQDLFVAETFAQRVSRIRIGADGHPESISVHVDNLPGLPDGLAIDSAGNLLVSCYEPSRILRVSPAGEVALYAHDPFAEMLCHPTNIAFAGDTLVSANLGRWHLTRIDATHFTEPLAARDARLAAHRD